MATATDVVPQKEHSLTLHPCRTASGYSSRVSWALALLMVGTVAVRLADPTGWLGADDAAYHAAAEHILAGETIHRVHHQYGRMAVIVPVAASMWVFGDSPFSVALPSLIASTGCVALVVLLGRFIWGWWEGLCAGAVVSVLPFFRMLSTTAYPDVHACFWTALAFVLALLAARSTNRRWAVAAGVGCGLAVGLAMSAKILAGSMVIGLIWVLWTRCPDRRSRFVSCACMAVGGLLYVLLDGLFYLWAADDFFYKVHALASSQANASLFGVTTDPAALRVSVWERLTMLLQGGRSEWGWIGVAFWPAALAVLLFNRAGRGLAVWAITAYLMIAFLPVRFADGPTPYPFFDGRAVLTTCVPFALCFAWVVRQGFDGFLPGRWAQRGRLIAVATLVLVALPYPPSLNGFRDRQTQRIGRAIQQLIVTTRWEDDRDIFVTPSVYVRFALLFPPELRSRLRIAIDDDSPDWWRWAAVDIERRRAPLPPPDQACLIATPSQLRGRAEFWDYGITLPRTSLKAWRRTTPVARIARYADKTIAPMRANSGDDEELLLLLAATPKDSPT